MFPSEVLLEIFSCYVEGSYIGGAWHILASVCRRWKSIALESPRRLNHRIFCYEICSRSGRASPSLRKKLDFWPPFPIVLTAYFFPELKPISREDDILVTLEHHDRVREVNLLDFSISLWEKILPLLQKPFPMLTDLHLHAFRYGLGMESIAPGSFLGGSAPRLRKLRLDGLPFPGLPKLLLSTTDLVRLDLDDIPDSGYITPEAMITCISALTKLEHLLLRFGSHRSRPEEREKQCRSPQTRSLLPSLTFFKFKGASEYLEDIADRIDAPLLNRLRISFFHQPIFDTPRLAQFISRTPNFKEWDRVKVYLWDFLVTVTVISHPMTSYDTILELDYRYPESGQPDFQPSSFGQQCTSCFPQHLISMVKSLVISGEEDRMDPGLWRELLQSFSGLKNLHLVPKIAPRFAIVLQGLVGEDGTQTLPVLQNIFLEERQPIPEGIQKFVSARKLAGQAVSATPITRPWDKNFARIHYRQL